MIQYLLRHGDAVTLLFGWCAKILIVTRTTVKLSAMLADATCKTSF